MLKILHKANNKVALAVVGIMFFGMLMPLTEASAVDRANGFDKGPSYTNVVPLKKVTFVEYDENSFLDDYAYLSAVPTAVFKDKNSNRLFSNPLLFYQDAYDVTREEELSLNARQGLDYFMEDWMGYCNGKMDYITSINVPKNKLDDEWNAKEYTIIESDNPYKISSELALNEWSYSNDAVVAVIKEEFKDTSEELFEGFIEGTLDTGLDIKYETFYSPQLNKLDPRYHYFKVPEGYKYLKARTWWASMEVGTPNNAGMPININAVIPPGDPDQQLYCNYEGEWMMAAISSNWNIKKMDNEKAETYVYATGDWRHAITDVPTKGPLGIVRTTGNILDIIKNMIKGVQYQTDISMFPGIELEITDEPPVGCRDVTFKLTWDNANAKLGFCLIGLSGEEILASTDEENDEQELTLGHLANYFGDEKYRVCVFSLSDSVRPVDFKVEYSWRQNYTQSEIDSLTSATEAAVLASTLNAPLLYISPSEMSESVEEVLYKLGVETVHLVDFNSRLEEDVENSLKQACDGIVYHDDLNDFYSEIMELTGQNDIIFTTIDPWTNWLVYEKKPNEETEAGLFIGPSAYIAAHHGSPVIIVDNHPQLLSATSWHTEYWKRNANGYQDVTVGPMFLTGRSVYNFLGELGFDKEGKETMITVADQFEFGAPWDRTFVGKAKPGRIFASPVDTAYFICRNIFYPALIFENPGMSSDGIELIQGSESKRRTLFPWGKIGLDVYKPSMVEKFTYPVTQLYICYEQNLNDVFEKYYHFKYITATDIIPGETPSLNPIDEGMVTGKQGSIWPDITNSEVVPKYLEKGGFSNVFSTSLGANVNNLNAGSLLWITSTHGDSARSGYLLTWDPEESFVGGLPSFIAKRFGFYNQENPVRGYDWYLGSTDNPDTMTMEIHGLLPSLIGNPNLQGIFATGLEIGLNEKPIIHGIATLLSYVPIIRRAIIDRPWLTDSSYYKDGLVIASSLTTMATSHSMTGVRLDEELDNIHSVGWLNSACLPAYKYMHVTMMRHGSVFQIIDPWATSWYGSFWLETIPRDIILGDTIGEAYMKGISHVGIQYVGDPPNFWWDIAENVCFYGDPDLRPYVPDTTFSDKNHWEPEDVKPLAYDEECTIDGHMPYGATGYPHEKERKTFLGEYLWLIVLTLVIILVAALVLKSRKRKK